MSKNSKSSQSDKESILLVTVIALIVALVVETIILISQSLVVKDVRKQLNDIEAKLNGTTSQTEQTSTEKLATEGQGITTYTYEHETLNSDQVTEFYNEFYPLVDSIKHKNSFVGVITSEEGTDTYIYNTKGEALAQSYDSSITAFTLSNGKQFKLNAYEEKVESANDVDAVDIAKNVLTIANNNKDKVQVFKMIPADETTTTREYRVDIKGKELAEQFYSLTDPAVAEEVMNVTSESLGEDFDYHFIVCYYINDENKEFSVLCYIVMDGQEYTSWDLYVPFEIGDWAYSEKMYGVDTETISYADMFDIAHEEIGEIQKIYFNKMLELGYMTQEEIDSAIEEYYSETLPSDLQNSDEEIVIDGNGNVVEDGTLPSGEE